MNPEGAFAMTPFAAPVLILGASARAAAFSALRAGLSPRCVDLFADADLAARCPAQRLSGRYPHRFVECVEEPTVPWLYTGGLENWPRLVARLAEARPLWGNGALALRRSRDPVRILRILEAVHLSCPQVVCEPGSLVPPGRWLVKLLRGSGGSGIRLLSPGEPLPAGVGRSFYLQQQIDGEPASALYLGDGPRTRLLGVTRQLVGEPWLGAGPFRYCGSLGPLDQEVGLRGQLQELGQVLGKLCDLRGLFGVDGVVQNEVFWPVEINPRYTASVEVLEHACGFSALALHARVFAPEMELSPLPRQPLGHVGKGIVFARREIIFPADGPWQDVLTNPRPVTELPPFADIPASGTRIEARRPVLTVLVQGRSLHDCAAELRARVAEVERWLYRDGTITEPRGAQP
jgi:predicted ATP-grasp superfamily ATP-dependent carboligase